MPLGHIARSGTLRDWAVRHRDALGKIYRVGGILALQPQRGAMASFPPEFDDLMAAALDQARRARDAGEVPIGAVVAVDGAIVGRGFNQPLSSGDPTAHAEIVAIRNAARAIGNYRLSGATLCTTIEPCLMCVGALVHARIGTLVFGAAEPKSGAVVSTVRGGELPGHNHRFAVVAGVCDEECRALLQEFFKARR
jgi:tRNA(adenine34) deaminase